jgi:hypothetical protein
LSSLQCWLTTLWSLAILNFHHLSISKPQSYLILTVHFICTLWKCPGMLSLLPMVTPPRSVELQISWSLPLCSAAFHLEMLVGIVNQSNLHEWKRWL